MLLKEHKLTLSDLKVLYDNVVEENQDKPILGGAMGKHKVCPKNAEEAHHLVSGSLFSLEIKQNVSMYETRL